MNRAWISSTEELVDHKKSKALSCWRNFRRKIHSTQRVLGRRSCSRESFWNPKRRLTRENSGEGRLIIEKHRKRLHKRTRRRAKSEETLRYNLQVVCKFLIRFWRLKQIHTSLLRVRWGSERFEKSSLFLCVSHFLCYLSFCSFSEGEPSADSLCPLQRQWPTWEGRQNSIQPHCSRCLRQRITGYLRQPRPPSWFLRVREICSFWTQNLLVAFGGWSADECVDFQANWTSSGR